jgi:hypothetical protein
LGATKLGDCSGVDSENLEAVSRTEASALGVHRVVGVVFGVEGVIFGVEGVISGVESVATSLLSSLPFPFPSPSDLSSYLRSTSRSRANTWALRSNCSGVRRFHCSGVMRFKVCQVWGEGGRAWGSSSLTVSCCIHLRAPRSLA